MAEAQKTTDLATVINELEKVVQEKPSNVMARHHLGLIYRQAGRIDEAIAQLEKAIEVILDLLKKNPAPPVPQHPPYRDRQ